MDTILFFHNKDIHFLFENKNTKCIKSCKKDPFPVSPVIVLKTPNKSVLIITGTTVLIMENFFHTQIICLNEASSA